MCENKPMRKKLFEYATQMPLRRLLFTMVAALCFTVTACTNAEEKMDAIQKTGYVIWFDKKFKVKKIDRPNEAVFIIMPDGMPVPVALEMVKPAEGP